MISNIQHTGYFLLYGHEQQIAFPRDNIVEIPKFISPWASHHKETGYQPHLAPPRPDSPQRWPTPSGAIQTKTTTAAVTNVIEIHVLPCLAMYPKKRVSSYLQ
jgi:hypothetical protein